MRSIYVLIFQLIFCTAINAQESVNDNMNSLEGSYVINKIEIEINFTASLVNNSSKAHTKSQLQNIANRLKNSINDFYNGFYDNDVNVNLVIDINVAEYLDSIPNSRHIISINDDICFNNGVLANAEVGGREMKLSNKLLTLGKPEMVNYWKNTGLNYKGESTFDRTVAHEFGHLVSLKDDNHNPSLMTQSGVIAQPLENCNYRRIDNKQINSIIEAYHKGDIFKG